MLYVCILYRLWKEGDNYGDMLKIARAGMMERGQRIFGIVNHFLLVIEILDAVLFRNFRWRVGRGRIVEDESRWEIGL